MESFYPDHENSKGIWSSTLKKWTDFHDLINDKLLELPHYAFRGQRRDDWKLESTLTRKIQAESKAEKGKIATEHLEHFRYAMRGRRDSKSVKENEEENLIWALGQHHGLATPLLDWSLSAYVGLFFAMAKSDELTDTEYRVVYCLNMNRLSEINKTVSDDIFVQDDPIEFYNPLSDENARLVSQNGLFTKMPYHLDLESWIERNYDPKEHTGRLILAKIRVPSKDRDSALKALNRMNINYLTLFPDLYGACKHSNLKLQIENY